MAISTRITNDTNKNCKVQIYGWIGADIPDDKPVVALDLEKLRDTPKNIRIDALWWLIEEKMGLRLWWKPGDFLLPLESRNSIRFDSPMYSRELAPPEWDRKLWLSSHDAGSNTTKSKYFRIALDMEKSQ